MSFVAVAIGGSALLGLGGALISSNASENAAQTQAQSSQNALNWQQQVWNQEQQNAAPYLAEGTSALGQLKTDLPGLLAGFDPAKAGLPAQFTYGAQQFQQDPGYQFALQQGQQAIQRSAAAQGGDVSGGTLKDLDSYTVGMADQDYSNAYQRALGTYQQNYSNAFNTYETGQQNSYNRLAALANAGLQATGMQNQAGQAFASNAGNYAIGAGNALAAGTVGSANAWNSALGGIGNSAMNGMLLSQLLGNNGMTTLPADTSSYLNNVPAGIVQGNNNFLANGLGNGQ